MEVALDFAIQCSPDHPWIKEHPEWFLFRPDGSIKYAENPPKKYQDIVNVDFFNDNWVALWEELLSTVLFWVDHGVKIFRVDNPHTKPIPFWEWLIREVKSEHPGRYIPCRGVRASRSVEDDGEGRASASPIRISRGGTPRTNSSNTSPN